MKLFARLLLFTFSAVAPYYLAWAGEHPQIAVDAQCVDCHADHATAAYTHPALQRGCAACHLIERNAEVTYVVLKPAKGAVCFGCHQPESYERVHFPYAATMCLRCHNPHGSANPRLLRAKANELCLQCHLNDPYRRPSGVLPTIVLTSNHTSGHPYEHHPVSGATDPLRGEEMSCVSCHLPHGSTMPHHLRMGAGIPADALNRNTETLDMCRKCHYALWGFNGVETGKKRKSRR